MAVVTANRKMNGPHCMCTYIYIYRERDRDTESGLGGPRGGVHGETGPGIYTYINIRRHTYIYIYIYIITYIYIYIYYIACCLLPIACGLLCGAPYWNRYIVC